MLFLITKDYSALPNFSQTSFSFNWIKPSFYFNLEYPKSLFPSILFDSPFHLLEWCTKLINSIFDELKEKMLATSWLVLLQCVVIINQHRGRILANNCEIFQTRLNFFADSENRLHRSSSWCRYVTNSKRTHIHAIQAVAQATEQLQKIKCNAPP